MYLEIKKLFEENRDETNAVKMAAYMRNQFSFYGLATPKRKSLCRVFLKDAKKGTVIDWNFLDQCWNDEYRELQYLAIDYLAAMQKFLTYDDITNIRKYVKTKQWWDTIDGLDRIIGNIAFVDDRVNDLMLQWSVDEDFWVRRIAIDHQLCRKDQTDRDLLEKILVNNLGSSEFFINKAIGWSLGGYSKSNPHWGRRFLERYRNQMNPLSIKEASKYL